MLLPARPRAVRTRTVGAQTKLDAKLLDKAMEFFDRDAETRWHKIAVDVATPTSKSRLQQLLLAGDSESLAGVDRDVLGHDLQQNATVSSMIEKRVQKLQAKFEEQLQSLRERNARLESVLQAAAAAGVPEAADPGLWEAGPAGIESSNDLLSIAADVSAELHSADTAKLHQTSGQSCLPGESASRQLSSIAADAAAGPCSADLVGGHRHSDASRSHVDAAGKVPRFGTDTSVDAVSEACSPEVVRRRSSISDLTSQRSESSALGESTEDYADGKLSPHSSIAVQCSILPCEESDAKLTSQLKCWSPICDTVPQAQLAVISEMSLVMRRKLREMSKSVQKIRASAGPGSILEREATILLDQISSGSPRANRAEAPTSHSPRPQGEGSEPSAPEAAREASQGKPQQAASSMRDRRQVLPPLLVQDSCAPRPPRPRWSPSDGAAISQDGPEHLQRRGRSPSAHRHPSSGDVEYHEPRRCSASRGASKDRGKRACSSSSTMSGASEASETPASGGKSWAMISPDASRQDSTTDSGLRYGQQRDSIATPGRDLQMYGRQVAASQWPWQGRPGVEGDVAHMNSQTACRRPLIEEQGDGALIRIKSARGSSSFDFERLRDGGTEPCHSPGGHRKAASTARPTSTRLRSRSCNLGPAAPRCKAAVEELFSTPRGVAGAGVPRIKTTVEELLAAAAAPQDS